MPHLPPTRPRAPTLSSSAEISAPGHLFQTLRSFRPEPAAQAEAALETGCEGAALSCVSRPERKGLPASPTCSGFMAVPRLSPPHEPLHAQTSTSHRTPYTGPKAVCRSAIPPKGKPLQVWSRQVTHVSPGPCNSPPSGKSCGKEGGASSRAGPCPGDTAHSLRSRPDLPRNDTAKPVCRCLLLLGRNRRAHGRRSSTRPAIRSGFGGSSGKDARAGAEPQYITWALKCFCLRALFFMPVFSIHAAFILCTNHMSRRL